MKLNPVGGLVLPVTTRSINPNIVLDILNIY